MPVPPSSTLQEIGPIASSSQHVPVTLIPQFKHTSGTGSDVVAIFLYVLAAVIISTMIVCIYLRRRRKRRIKFKATTIKAVPQWEADPNSIRSVASPVTLTPFFAQEEADRDICLPIEADGKPAITPFPVEATLAEGGARRSEQKLAILARILGKWPSDPITPFNMQERRRHAVRQDRKLGILRRIMGKDPAGPGHQQSSVSSAGTSPPRYPATA